MRFRSVLVLVASLLIGVTTVQAQMGRGPGADIQKYFEQMGLPKEFAVTAQMEAKNMPPMGPMRMAVKNKKSRMEMSQGPMGKMVMIHDADANKSYMVFPASKTYMEVPVMQPPKQEDKAKEPKVEIKELGEEQKDGHACTKRLITVTDPEQPKPMEMTVWNAKDMQNLPVRMETKTDEGVMAITYKDYDTKAQDESLFKVPADYKKGGFGGMPMPPQGAGDGAAGED